MTAAQPPPRAPAKQPLVTKYHVEVLAGEDSATALPLASNAEAAAGQAAAAEAAAAAAAAAVEDDEPMLEEPQAETKMSEAKAAAAGELAKQGDHKAAVELWAQAINGDPANPALYCKRGYSLMQLQKEPDAVRDFTICLDLPGCPQEAQFQALLCRGMIKRDLGDLTAASADLRAARQAAPGPKDSDEAQAQLRLLVERQVAQKRKEKERKETSKPVVHRYGTAIIEEIDGDEESMGAQEALVHERVAAWEEVALKTASQARGSAARLARALEAERTRIREENKARAERNAVRAARRREAAERARQAAQQAAQAEQQAQQAKEQGAAQQQQVWVERTRIPIQTVDGTSVAAGNRSSSRSESSRSTRSKLAGYESESESEGEAAAPGAAAVAAGQVAAEQQQQQAEQPAAAATAAKEPVPPPGIGAAESDGPEKNKAPAEGSPVAVAAAEESQATAGAEDEVINLLEAAEALAAADDAKQAARPEGEVEEEEPEAEEGQAAAGGAPAAVGAAAAGSEEAQPFVAPSDQERAAALLTEEQLDALKDEADQLQRELKHEAAEERYARYLRLRPSDPRAWSNRAENCMNPGRWQEALEYCNHGLAITTPSHPLSKSKLLSRRGRAYHGLGRLQEALRDLEAAEAGAEAEGDIKLKHDVTKRMAKLLREMEAKGIERAPRTAAELGLQGAAAAAQVELPSIPVVPQGPQHEVPESLGVAEEEGRRQQRKEGKQPALKAGQAAAVEVPAGGSADPSSAASSAPAGDTEAPADQKQASQDAKQKGNACFHRHQWRQAVRHYDRAVELDPQNKEALCNKAAALLKLKQWQEAADVAEQALLVDPGYLKARYRKAHAYAGMQEWNAAVLDMEIVEEEMRAEGQAMNKDDQLFLAEWRRRKQQAAAEGLCSFVF